MIPRYATPSIITRSLARRAPPTHKGPVTSPGLPTRTRSQSIDWRSFHTSMLGNLESFLGNSPGLTAGGPGSHRGLSCSRERFWLRNACALEHHEADYCVVSITLFSSRICRSRNHTSCGHLRCVCGNLSLEIWSRIGSEVNSGDFPDRNLEVWVDNVVAHPRNHALNEMRSFFLMNSDVGYVIAAWRRQSERILRIGNPSFPGAVWRDPWWELYAENHVETKCSGMSLTSAFLE